MFRHIKHIHFVGIGGIGVSGIAELLINSGYKISGSDIHLSLITQRLEKLGAHIFSSHQSKNIGLADVVVYSSAISPSNPELKAARRKNIPCIPRAEILGELMRMRESIAIAGTHGKTTITSMVGAILDAAGLDPTIVVGGKLRSIGTNVKLGAGKFIVCEVDESDKLFLALSPVITVLTSIDNDHLDSYKDIEEIKEAFLNFTHRVPFYGCNIVCGDDKNIKSILNKIEKRYVTYGFSKGSNLRIHDYESGLISRFRLQSNGDVIGPFTLYLPGMHNILNAAGAIATGIELEIPPRIIIEAVSKFKGVHRRFELKGEISGIKIMDDYAHHPREIEVTLKTARSLYSGRIILIFQPHLFSRTQKLSAQFGDCFWDADLVIVTPIYPAREKPIPGVTGKLIVDSAQSQGYKNIFYMESKDKIISWCLKNLKKGDTLFTIGAGDIYKMGDKLIKKLPNLSG